MPSDKSDIIQTGHDSDNEGLYGKWYDCLIKIIVEACGEGNYNLYIADCEVYFKDVILRLLKSEGKILSKMKVTRRKRELGIEPEMSESVQEGLWAEGWRCWRRQTWAPVLSKEQKWEPSSVVGGWALLEFGWLHASFCYWLSTTCTHVVGGSHCMGSELSHPTMCLEPPAGRHLSASGVSSMWASLQGSSFLPTLLICSSATSLMWLMWRVLQTDQDRPGLPVISAKLQWCSISNIPLIR